MLMIIPRHILCQTNKSIMKGKKFKKKFSSLNDTLNRIGYDYCIYEHER